MRLALETLVYFAWQVRFFLTLILLKMVYLLKALLWGVGLLVLKKKCL